MGEKSLLWMKETKKRLTLRLGGTCNVRSWFNAAAVTCLGLFLNVDYGFAFSCRVKNKTVDAEKLLVEEHKRFYVV